MIIDLIYGNQSAIIDIMCVGPINYFIPCLVNKVKENICKKIRFFHQIKKWWHQLQHSDKPAFRYD